MRVLMFGWEFPPNITGGLGTACYGLTRGLSTLPDVEVTFVVPKAYGNEEKSNIQLIGAGEIPVRNRKISLKDLQKSIEYFEVESGLVPYIDPLCYEKQSRFDVESIGLLLKTDNQGRLQFSGKYGPDLMSEIARYALVANFIARDNQFDVIHAHDWLAYPAGMAAKEASGKPLVIHVHATDFDRSGNNVNPDVYAIERKGMEAADHIITVSNLTRQIVIDRYHINPKKVVTVYNAVEPLKDEDEIQQIRKGVTDKVVTFLGRITMQKGPEYFVEAAARVLRKMDNVRFVMAGSGEMMNKIIKRVATLGIANKFHFTGFLKGNEVFRLLKMSDLFIMPSVSEPFGISPLEAMQTGVPAIVSKQSGVAEILTHALKVNFWDIDAIADAIHGIISYPAMSRSLIRNGMSETDNFKWEYAALKVREIYQNAIMAG
jgi:glycosyltransferase involved in cell wall biosynthesis